MDNISIYALYDEFGVIRYVGKTKNLLRRFNTHRKIKSWAIGIKVLEWTTEDKWKEREKYWIMEFNSPFLTNLHPGGIGGCEYRHSEEAKKRIGLAASIRRKGKVPWNKGLKGAQIAWNKGLILGPGKSLGPVPKERKRKISNSVKEWYKTHSHPFQGKTHTEESRKKMSSRLKGREVWNKGISKRV